jgi:hypothetical protein
MNLIVFLIITAAFFTLWRVIRYVNIRLKTRGYFRDKNLLPLVAVMLFLVWVYFSLWYFLAESSIYSSSIQIVSLVLILPGSIFFGKDIIAGILLQIKGSINIGTQLNTTNGTVQILKIGYRGILVSTDKNEITKVLYSDLKIIRTNTHEDAIQEDNLISFDLTMNETNEKTIIKRLNLLAYSSPWIKTGTPPTITVKTQKGTSEVKITLELISNAYQEKFKKHLEGSFK